MGDIETLISAISVGNTARAKEQLNKLNPRKLSSFGGVDLASPLYYAAKTGNLQVAEVLVSKGCEIDNGSVSTHITPFMIAGQGGHLYVMQFLLESGCNVHLKDTHGRNALHMAVESGDMYIVKFLAQEAGMSINERNGEGKTAFFMAVELGHHSIAEVLIDCNADVAACDDRGYSPLMIACEQGRIAMAKVVIHELLMANKPYYVNDVDRRRRSALYFAVKNKHFELVEPLLKAGAHVCITRAMDSKKHFTGDNPVFEAITTGNMQLLNELMANKSFDINQTFQNQNVSAVHWAVLLHCQKLAENDSATFLTSSETKDVNFMIIIRKLLELKPDLNMIDTDYHSPLHTAASYGIFPITQLLVQHGAEINSRCQQFLKTRDGDRYFFKPIDCALLHGHVDVVKYLVSKGAFFILKDWQRVPELDEKLTEQPDLVEWVQLHRK